MGVSDSSESGRGGRGRAARQKGEGQRKNDLNTGRYGQFFRLTEHLATRRFLPSPEFAFLEQSNRKPFHRQAAQSPTFRIN